MDLAGLSRSLDDRIAAIAEQVAKRVVDQRLANFPSNGANIAMTTGSTGIPLVGDDSYASPQCFVHVPFPFMVTGAYAALDLADTVKFDIRVYYPEDVGGSGPVGGFRFFSGPLTISSLEQSYDPVTSGWESHYIPAGAKVILYVTLAGGVAGVLTLNLFGRVVVR